MSGAPAFRADDRVLLLEIPAFESVAVLARILVRGVLVALGKREDVDRARQYFADSENLMFIEGTPSRIPWRDSYFTKVVAPEETAEVARVLAPGGVIVKP